MPRSREASKIVWHLRVKRKKDTYFVALNNAFTGGTGKPTIKDLRSGAARAMRIEPCDLQLCLPPQEGTFEQPVWFQDEQTIEEVGLQNDAIVCAILKDENAQWEVPQIDAYPEPPKPPKADKKPGAASSQHPTAR